MEKLPAKLLTELITAEEIRVAEGVKAAHEVGYCPVGVFLPGECLVSQDYYSGEGHISEFRYTPQARFALKVWESARDTLLKSPEFARALEVEWYPVAATFRSVRFINGSPERFIAAMFGEMKRLADSAPFDIRYGRFDLPPLPERPGIPRRYYIMPPELMAERWCRGMSDELEPIQDAPAGSFAWKDIEDAFVVLKPIQLAFIAGDEMNNYTALDEEFLDACADFDFEKVRATVEKGANIHAAGPMGETAMTLMMASYHDPDFEDAKKNGRFVPTHRNREKFMRIARYLLSLGYNVNISGYCSDTCLYDAPHVEDMEIVKFLLDNGADPNAGSYIGEDEPYGVTVLNHTWDDLDGWEEPWCEKLSLYLLRRGALPVPEGERLTEDDLDWRIEEMKEKNEWDDSLCAGLSKYDAALVNSAARPDFFRLARIARSGGNVQVKDAKGRNLLQIVLEEYCDVAPSDTRSQRELAELSLMLLCGLKLKLSETEIELAKETCRTRGFAEALEAISSVADSK